MAAKENFFVPTIHPDCIVQGKSFTGTNAKKIAEQLINEGEIHEQEVGRFLLEWIHPNPYINVKTSGSTGTPKEIEVYKRHMINSAKATGRFFKVQEQTTALLCLSANYIAGKMMLVRAIVLGWNLDIVTPKVNPMDTLYKHYDFCAMVPLQLDNSLNRLHLIKKLIVGGGRVSVPLIDLVQGIKTKVFETYGMTETVSHIAARRLNPKKKEKKEISYFKALPDITLSVDNRKCLIIKAPQLSYDTIITNDVVELKSYKKFLLKGRFDNVINSGGIKLYPEEIEVKLQKIISHRFFISSLPDPKLGDRLIIVVEDFDRPKNIERLKEAIDNVSTLTKYQIPKEIYCIPQFVQTETGKVQRKQTLELIK
ncbi:AMP-binding protein [Aquimarina sp. ERC-38]|uniref:AMP-binding protein n=1 Tax=Aquimarina sp. ERC-38 TaxID=2949996 RepID=UPI0022461C57|nr:AMP-binding protein [Aquimarina sp. ERC-38]UZO80202.1 AMP-binding protein [Aquimarina sp. ERC-38]